MRGQVKDIEFDYNIKGQILSYLVLEFFSKSNKLLNLDQVSVLESLLYR